MSFSFGEQGQDARRKEKIRVERKRRPQREMNNRSGFAHKIRLVMPPFAFIKTRNSPPDSCG